MSLFDKLKLQELNKVIHDLPFHKHQTNRKEIAHFCEHNGISVRFTEASRNWHALAPCALKPWWLSLQPRLQTQQKDTEELNKIKQQDKNKITKNTAIEAELIEETENA